MSKYSYKKSVQLDGGYVQKMDAGEYAVFADGEHIGYVEKADRDAWRARALIGEQTVGVHVDNGWSIFHNTRREATWAIEARRREEVTV